MERWIKLSNGKLKHKKLIVIVLIVVSVIASILYIALHDGGFGSTKNFPDVITVDDGYYLKKAITLDYQVVDMQDSLMIVEDTSNTENEYSMGLANLDGAMLIEPVYSNMCFINSTTIKGWKSETEVCYFDNNGLILDSGSYSDLKDTYEETEYEIPEYTIEEFVSTVYSNDENGNPQLVVGKYVEYGTTKKEIVFPKNASFKEVTIANVKGKLYSGDVYDQIYYYSNEDKRVLVKKDRNVYYCDLDGKAIFNVDCSFIEDDEGNPCFVREGYGQPFPIYMFENGYAITVKGQDYGVINLEGNTIIDFRYKDIIKLPYNLYLAIDYNDNCAICDISRNTGLNVPYFKDVKSFEDIIVTYDETSKQYVLYTIELNV